MWDVKRKRKWGTQKKRKEEEKWREERWSDELIFIFFHIRFFLHRFDSFLFPFFFFWSSIYRICFSSILHYFLHTHFWTSRNAYWFRCWIGNVKLIMILASTHIHKRIKGKLIFPRHSYNWLFGPHLMEHYPQSEWRKIGIFQMLFHQSSSTGSITIETDQVNFITNFVCLFVLVVCSSHFFVFCV